jgi:hypothetical protein
LQTPLFSPNSSENSPFFEISYVSRKTHPFELKLSEYNEDCDVYYWEVFRRKFLVEVSFMISCDRMKIQRNDHNSRRKAQWHEPF